MKCFHRWKLYDGALGYQSHKCVKCGQDVADIISATDCFVLAAAPDMLAALEKILASFHASVKTTEALDQFPALKAVHDAIALAKGA